MPTKPREGRVQAQTLREWAYEYDQGEPVWPAAWGDCQEGYITTPDDFDPGFKSAPTN